LLIAIPGSAVVGGIVLLSLSIWSDDGLVVDDYYRKGLAINRTLERDHAAAQYGLSAHVQLDRERGSMRASLSASNAFVAPHVLHLSLLHATRAGFDHDVLLERLTSTEYVGALPPLVPGRWYVQLAADDWRLLGALRAPSDSQVHITANQDER
jgi:hypothetical protein